MIIVGWDANGLQLPDGHIIISLFGRVQGEANIVNFTLIFNLWIMLYHRICFIYFSDSIIYCYR